jgi:ABC-type bacteriocin/lantibiotic exporter with double-glycine peptidase domain
MPRTVMGYVFRFTRSHQVGLAALSIAVFLLSAVPLELQRRIVNDLIGKGSFVAVFWLAAGYAGVALTEQVLKLMLNVYRGWVAERSVRELRTTVYEGEKRAAVTVPSSLDTGVEIAMILEEAEPIGGFIGISISEPLLQGGILFSVIGYMFFLEPWLALVGIVFFIPQMIFVPLLQHAINVRARERILVKRGISGALADDGSSEAAPSQTGAIGQVFKLQMGIYWRKYSMNLLMNLMYHLAVAVVLSFGGWLALQGRIEVGTVVAMVGGLAKLNDPWGDVVNWAREFSVVSVKYRLYAGAANWLTGSQSAPGKAAPLGLAAVHTS